MELTFQYGKTNKPNKLKDVMRPDRKRSQQESGDYKGKKGMQLNSDYAEVTDNSANNSNREVRRSSIERMDKNGLF